MCRYQTIKFRVKLSITNMAISVKLGYLLVVLGVILLVDITLAGTSGYVDHGDTKGKSIRNYSFLYNIKLIKIAIKSLRYIFRKIKENNFLI